MTTDDGYPLSKRLAIGCGLALVLVPLSLGVAGAGVVLMLIALNGLPSLSALGKFWLFWLWPTSMTLVSISALGAWVAGLEKKRALFAGLVVAAIAFAVYLTVIPVAMWTR